MYILRLWSLLVVLLSCGGTLRAQSCTFTHMDAFDGLSDNKIQHILQLPDGRMVFTTPKTINLYDGFRFRYFTAQRQDEVPLPAYRGAYHVYVGEGDVLWVKDYGALACFDVRHERYVADLKGLLSNMNRSQPVVDVFLDSGKTVWLVLPDGSIWNARLKRLFRCPSGIGELQDLDVMDGRVFFFFSSGKVVAASLKTGRVAYVSAAFTATEAARYDRMSLVVKGADGNFYQVRNGRSAVCLQFNPRTRAWKRLLETPYLLHTLIVPGRDEAWITCGQGLWRLDLHTGRAVYKPALRTVDGGSLVTDINTVFIDREGGWWLGTSNNGLLYGHEWRDTYGMDRALRGQLPLKVFSPLLVGVSVNGKPLAVGGGQDALLPQGAPFMCSFDFEADQNTVSFDFSALNYAFPMQTYYRYRLVSGKDSTWHYATFNPQNKAVDERGVLHLPFSRLSPGAYRLQVAASTRPGMAGPCTEVTFYVRAPWWRTGWAYAGIAGVVLAAGCALMYRRNERRRKEQALLDRIRELIDKCNKYEADTRRTEGESVEVQSSHPLLQKDDEFLQKAVNLVRAHLNGAYSVEELSRDLCMERTGLYKKLTALLDQSPSLFIRNIRLQQAARLLLEGRRSISDIAMETGFSSSSYFSKCFQEMYGCKPSEYAEKQGKST